MITIKDVAAEAGVAISTVSKVLNNYPGISIKTKEKVNSAVAKLGFTPNAVAAALSSKMSGRIALIMKMGSMAQSIDEINVRYMSGAIEAALEYGLDPVTIFFNMIEDMDVDTLVSYLKSQSIEGIIIYGLSKEDSIMTELVNMELFKTVLIDAPIINASTSTVSIDHKLAQHDIIMKSLEGVEGKKILYIAGKKSCFSTDSKIEGLKLVEEELGMTSSVTYGNFSELQARNIVFEQAQKYDLIACGSDLMAIGAMRALMEMDIFKPVCGFDGIRLMAYAGKQMNTVRQDFGELSRMAIAELRRLLDGGEGTNVIASYELVRMKYEDALI